MSEEGAPRPIPGERTIDRVNARSVRRLKAGLATSVLFRSAMETSHDKNGVEDASAEGDLVLLSGAPFYAMLRRLARARNRRNRRLVAMERRSERGLAQDFPRAEQLPPRRHELRQGRGVVQQYIGLREARGQEPRHGMPEAREIGGGCCDPRPGKRAQRPLQSARGARQPEGVQVCEVERAGLAARGVMNQAHTPCMQTGRRRQGHRERERHSGGGIAGGSTGTQQHGTRGRGLGIVAGDHKRAKTVSSGCVPLA